MWVVVERGENDGGAGVKPLDSWIDEYVRDLVAMDEAKKEEAPEAATQAAWSRTVFPYALPARFQFMLNQDKTRSAPTREKRHRRGIAAFSRTAAGQPKRPISLLKGRSSAGRPLRKCH